FWSGGSPLADMTAEMSETSQPRPLASLVESFGRLVAAHGFAGNLVVVIVLAAAGLGLLSAPPRLVPAAPPGPGARVGADGGGVRGVGGGGGGGGGAGGPPRNHRPRGARGPPPPVRGGPETPPPPPPRRPAAPR